MTSVISKVSASPERCANVSILRSKVPPSVQLFCMTKLIVVTVPLVSVLIEAEKNADVTSGYGIAS